MENGKIIVTIPVRKEVLSAEDFLSLVQKNPDLIKRSSPQPAKLGKSNFGGVCVEYSKPIYKMTY